MWWKPLIGTWNPETESKVHEIWWARMMPWNKIQCLSLSDHVVNETTLFFIFNGNIFCMVTVNWVELLHDSRVICKACVSTLVTWPTHSFISLSLLTFSALCQILTVLYHHLGIFLVLVPLSFPIISILPLQNNKEEKSAKDYPYIMDDGILSLPILKNYN